MTNAAITSRQGEKNRRGGSAADEADSTPMVGMPVTTYSGHPTNDVNEYDDAGYDFEPVRRSDGSDPRVATVSRAEVERQHHQQIQTREAKLTKWDREPVRDDWRFYVGTIGKILIATGLLMFAFVAYQLWGTGIETARKQSELSKQVETQLAEIATPAAAVGNVGIVGSVPAAEAVAEPGSGTSTLDTGGGGTAPVATKFDPALIPTEPAVPLPPVVKGNALFVIEAPTIKLKVNVLPGVDVETLKDGPGHYPETPLPGQLGNASVAGHRTTHGQPFFNVGDLKIGDELIVTMLNGDRFVYNVASTEVVGPNDYFIVTTRDPSVAMLTLTTCTPKYTSKQRLAVHAVLNPERSSQVTAASAPYALSDGPSVAKDGDFDSPVVDTGAENASAAAGSADVAVDGTQSVDASAAATPDTTSGSSEVASPAAADENLQDAFAQGWFSDRSAFPQIAFWGGVLIVISLLAYSLSRQTRHDSIGLLVGVVPFALSLYFFFENFNRLLPPGL